MRLNKFIDLRINDIERDRGLKIIRGGKGNKDRISILSQKVLSLLIEYCEEYQSVEFLFEGQKGRKIL